MRLRLDLAYDGTGFRGFAANVGVRTVGGTLAEALEQVLSQPVEITCAGRTDSGVHARRQVVSFDVAAAADIDLDRLVRSLRRLCGPEISVLAAEAVSGDFDARFSAQTRAYRYSILTSEAPDPLRRHVCWHLPEPLALDAMAEAAAHFVGEHDFASFCRRQANRSLVRNVVSAEWRRSSDLLLFDVSASSFCHQMVRSLVGTMVDVGRGRLDAADMADVLGARDRHAAPTLAPPHGLCLWDVTY